MQIRKALRTDFRGVAAVAYATGFFGESAARFFPDRRLFADLWVAPYLGSGTQGCSFVALQDDEIIGYVLASSDTARYRKRVVRSVGVILKRLFQGKYRQLWGCIPYLLRLWRYTGPPASLQLYPAHLHINLLAAARGRGAGRKLLDSMVNCCRERQLAGIQLSTTSENTAALRLYESFGFRVIRSRRTALWRPWLGRDTTQLTLVLDLHRP